MAIAILPKTRTVLIERINHVLIPKVADSFALGGGMKPLGASTFGNTSLAYSTASPLMGGNTGQLILLQAGTSQGAKLLEQNLSTLKMGTSTTYTVSLYINSPSGHPNPILLINGAGVAGTGTYSAATATKNSWTRISATITTAATNGLISVYLFFDSAGFVNTYTLFDALQIDDGATPTPFFDGEGPMVADSTRYFRWEGTRYNSLSDKYTLDPSEISNPVLMKNGFHAGKDNGNILHRTLNNQLVVVRRLATMSIGTHLAFFDRRDDAFRLYSLLDRLDDFQLIDNQNPETGMFFAVSGRVTIDQEPWPGLRWTVSIPFEQTG